MDTDANTDYQRGYENGYADALDTAFDALGKHFYARSDIDTAAADTAAACNAIRTAVASRYAYTKSRGNGYIIVRSDDGTPYDIADAARPYDIADPAADAYRGATLHAHGDAWQPARGGDGGQSG